MFSNSQGTCLSVAMAAPKGSGFRIVADHWAMNQVVKQSTIPMPRLEESGILLGGTAAFCTLDMIQRYWQMALHERESARELFTTVTTGGRAVYAEAGATIGSQSQVISRKRCRRC